VTNATVLIWKVLLVAEQTFRWLDGHDADRGSSHP
jgi:hypothetical protein